MFVIFLLNGFARGNIFDESSWFIDSSQLVHVHDSSFSQSFRADDLRYAVIVRCMRWVRAFAVSRASTLSAAAMMIALPLSASAALGGDVSWFRAIA